MDFAMVNLSVVDVYDEAALIGKEFETIIDHYGAEAVTELMPRVIRVLEQLEILANQNEKENDEVSELRTAVHRLETEKSERTQERLKYEKELEQIEDAWRSEANDLIESIAKLQEENNRLHESLDEKKTENSVKLHKKEEEDLVVLKKMKESLDKQREHIRTVERELRQKTVDNEALQAQLERVSVVTTDLRRKHKLVNKQAKHLLEEKSDLQTQVQDQEQQIHKIKEQFSHDVDSPPNSAKGSSSSESTEEIEDKLSKLGKMVVDMKDPDRPRFTLNELKAVLTERNELKAKLAEVQEELNYYKPKEEEVKQEEDPDDLPVHGPINKEPFDKLYPDLKESGIRKFFRSFWGGSSKPKEQPRRTSGQQIPQTIQTSQNTRTKTNINSLVDRHHRVGNL